MHDLPKHCIEFGAEATKTGITLIYNENVGNLWAAAPCHWNTTLWYKKGSSHTYSCGSCDKEYTLPAGSPKSTIDMVKDRLNEWTVKTWVALWLGVNPSEVKVTIR